MRVALAAALLLCPIAPVVSFTARNAAWLNPAQPFESLSTKQKSAQLFATGGQSEEKELREEIQRRNEEVEDEAKYAVLDGVIEETEGVTEIAVGLSPLQKKINQAAKTRPYLLFLLEKVTQVVDDVIDSFSQEYTPLAQKERVIVLGTGWGSHAFLKDIDCDKFDVTVISPRNFFLFTPMLAGASVGTVEYRSITEPVRQINPGANYLEGTATNIDVKNRKLTCATVVCEGNSCDIDEFDVEYDRLVFAVGAQTNTFGIPGVKEYCCFLKQVEDAQKIRNSIVNLFERANLPGLTEEERQNILTFAVIGAGPTGIEFASELRDFIEQDGWKFYPDLLKYVKIKVIEASSTVLAPFDKNLQDTAIEQLTRRTMFEEQGPTKYLPQILELTELLLNRGVSEVTKDTIEFSDGTFIPYGMAVWAAGNGPLPITLNLIEELKDTAQADAQEVARGRLAVDKWLRVTGTQGEILSIGDCSCIIEDQLPATAQVASQQGEYLARLLSRSDMEPVIEENMLLPPVRTTNRRQTFTEGVAALSMRSNEIAAPFQFLNLGILAYTGQGSALAQLQLFPSGKSKIKGTGKTGFGLWRSVYLTKQVSNRNRFLVFTDWAKARIFGRDITRV